MIEEIKVYSKIKKEEKTLRTLPYRQAIRRTKIMAVVKDGDEELLMMMWTFDDRLGTRKMFLSEALIPKLIIDSNSLSLVDESKMGTWEEMFDPSIWRERIILGDPIPRFEQFVVKYQEQIAKVYGKGSRRALRRLVEIIKKKEPI